MKPSLSIPLARAIAEDAANRQMRKAGRSSWSRADFNTACRTLAKLSKQIEDQATASRRKFQAA